MARLRLTEIFLSLQGESRTVGLPTVFVRLTGCPLRCDYCDTVYAFKGGTWWEVPAIVGEVRGYGVTHVTVTGGEPLAQADCAALLGALCDAGFEVSLETSGAMDIKGVDVRVSRVMDLKTPGSGEMDSNHLENIDHLTPMDQVKFVICDVADYDWAVGMLREHRLQARCEVLFSPAWQQMDATLLADWVVRDRLPVRFQMQLHKILWGDAAGK